MKLLHLADCNDSLPPGTTLALAGIKEADFLAFIFSEIIPLSSSTCTPLLLHRSLAAASHSSYNILQHICKRYATFSFKISLSTNLTSQHCPLFPPISYSTVAGDP